MSKTCKCAIFDADNWCFNCTLTKDTCVSGKHFPDFDNCPRNVDDSFVYDSIKEKFDILFPSYAEKTIFWSPCHSKSTRGFTSIVVVIDGYKPFIFDYKDDNKFGLYSVGCDDLSVLSNIPKELAEKSLNDFNKKEEV